MITLTEHEVLIDNIKYTKISSIKNHLGQFDIFFKSDKPDHNIYFFEVDKNKIYKLPEPHVLEKLRSTFIQNEIITDIQASSEDSRTSQLFREKLNA